MANVYLSDEDDLIDIRHDNVFKAVFTKDNPASKGALSRLVSALIGRVVQVDSIKANEPPIDNLRDRQIRFDISCIAKSGELINVEMSLNPDPFEPVRLEYYEGKLLIGQDIRGMNYNYNDLKQAYQIAILANERFFPDKEFFHIFEYYDPLNAISLNGKSRIITIELSKLDTVVEKPIELMTAKEYWAVYFQYLTDKSKRRKINDIMEREEGIAMASEVLFEISKDDIERARLLSELKYELDMQSKRVTAEREGHRKGLEQVAKNALEKGLSVDLIRDITGLDIETIERLRAK